MISVRPRRALFAALALLVTLAVPSIARAQDPARAQDIVLGFFNKSLPDGAAHNLVNELETAKGGLDYFEWDQMGLPHVEMPHWDDRRVWAAMELVAETGHRIHFNLTGFRFAGDRNALELARDVSAGSAGYTSWELTQIRTHRSFWDRTDFFVRQDDGSYRQATKAQLDKLGLHYTAPELPALGALKGKLLRSSATEDVYAVKNRPGQELVVRRAIPGETDAERDRRAEDLVEAKAALDKLAAQGVHVVARHEVGTFKGELAFVRDALAGAPVTSVVSDGKTLELSRDASGEVALSGIASPHVRVDAEVSSDLASTVKTALTTEASRESASRGETAPASDVDPALLAKLKARDAAADQGKRTGLSQALDDRTRERAAGDRDADR